MSDKIQKRKPGEREEYEIFIDHEIDALREVVMAMNRVDDESRLRIFQFLKSKYDKSWPLEN